MKITFDEELTHEGVKFEKVAVLEYPKKGQHYFSCGIVYKARYSFEAVRHLVLTPKKKVYTVIKVEGDYSSENPNKVENLFDVVSKLYTSPIRGTVQTVEE